MKAETKQGSNGRVGGALRSVLGFWRPQCILFGQQRRTPRQHRGDCLRNWYTGEGRNNESPSTPAPYRTPIWDDSNHRFPGEPHARSVDICHAINGEGTAALLQYRVPNPSLSQSDLKSPPSNTKIYHCEANYIRQLPAPPQLRHLGGSSRYTARIHGHRQPERCSGIQQHPRICRSPLWPTRI